MGKITDQTIQEFLKNNVECTIRLDEIKKALTYLETQKGYIPQQILGAGNFGIVIKVNSLDEYEYAIKIIVSNTEDPIIKAAEEADVIEKVRSKYVVKYINHFSYLEQRTFFIVTEYCAKGNMKSLVENPLQKEEIIKLFLSLMYGLRDLQRADVIHCDLKPDNILISNKRKLKICDFGLAKFSTNRKAYFTKVGNLLYMPPEGMLEIMKDGKYVVTSSYDVYSAGGILIYLCNPALEQKLISIKSGIFPDLKDEPFADLIEIAYSMMTKDPIQRKTIGQVIAQLEPLITQKLEEEDDEDEEELVVYLSKKLSVVFKYLERLEQENIPD